MGVFKIAISALMAVAFLGSTDAMATCAPPPPLFDKERKLATDGAINQIMRFIGIDFSVKGATVIRSILPKFESADQTVVVLTIIYNYCQLISSDRTLNGAEKAKELNKLIKDLIINDKIPKSISKTFKDDRSNLPSAEEQIRPEIRGHIRLFPFFMLASDAVATHGTRETSNIWGLIYLNQEPLLITIGNKHFVIVGSAKSEKEGKEIMQDLKRKNPDLDFALFEPYGNNPNYGIMLASWTSRKRAEEALTVAKKRINDTSFIWSCRSEGDSC